MEATSKPTLLIVHGGWHFPDSYSKLTGALRTAGFEVHIPRHLSMNQSRPPNADLAADSDLIRSYATSLVEAGRDVAVLMHSYGGQVGTNSLYGLSKNARSAKGLSGGITHLIYMATFALPEGKAMIDKVEEFGHLDRMPVAFGFDEDQSCVANFPKEGLIGEPYADQIDQEELKTYIASLGRWNGKCMYLPLQNTPAWRDDVKLYFIYTLGDLTVPVDYQRSMVQHLVEKEGKTIETIELESGHSPNLTATKAVVDAVVKFTSE
ncbi:alpha/beta-hydrolase [Hypoxylon rubiginosum]|uniref:Alpha/beta-hydrolase n=1 Tax=Hypoxylon rubiginosum TaxID=110542 RepID=A0ACB9YIE4_9PEZI|nr:alpha/beta-hydrolase [Hypoxylon rubiginosum]